MKRAKHKRIDTEFFIERCKEAGLKITPQRVTIFQSIARSKEHPTAEIVYKKVKRKLPNISFDTVNRTLMTFAKLGVLALVEGYGEPKRFDSNPQPHHHFRCLQCGALIDFYDKQYNDLKIPKEISKKFTIFNKRILLEGLCDRCKA